MQSRLKKLRMLPLNSLKTTANDNNVLKMILPYLKLQELEWRR